MFIRLLIITSILFASVVQSAVTNSSKGQPSAFPILPKQTSVDDDYDLNDKKTNIEGSGGTASLDEYADEEIDDQLSKITATTISSSTSTTTTTTTIKLPEQKKKNESSAKINNLDADEFNEDYKDDLEDDVDYNEMTTKITSVSFSSTRPTSVVQHRTPLRVFFSFLTRPPIAAGILAGSYIKKQIDFQTKKMSFLGLAIGILTSVILLICIVQRFHKRQRAHSSYTTGLLYPNQYGYSKSPQEFYA